MYFEYTCVCVRVDFCVLDTYFVLGSYKTE